MTSNADRSPAFQAPAHLGTRLPQSSSTSCRRSIVMQTPGPVFVAGGTGRVGQRVVRELAQRGVEVRLACRNPQKGQRIVEDLLPPETQSKVECVEFDVTKDENITSETLRGAETVVSALGIGENDLLKSPFGPYQIDGRGTTKLIEIARDSGVKKFVLVTSLGTGTPWKFPTVLFNLFWGLLVWKKKAEDALIDSRMNYTSMCCVVLCQRSMIVGNPGESYISNISLLHVMLFLLQLFVREEWKGQRMIGRKLMIR